MSKINSVIPHQSFELVRDRLAEILAEELSNQHALSAEAVLNADVWIERATPVNLSELPAVAVSFAKGDYENSDTRQVDGNYTYYVDCSVSAESTAQARGDKLAALALQRLLGVCRAILKSPAYRTLDYQPPFNCSLEVSAIMVGDPSGDPDASSSVSGRLEVMVRIPEYSVMQSAVPIAGSQTTVKLDLTDQGYVYRRNSPIAIGTQSLSILATEDGRALIKEPAYS